MDQNYMLNQWEIARTIDDIAYDLDTKNLTKALESFSEDVQFEILEDGKTVLKTQGKEAMKESIASRLANYDLVFHSNGTRMIDVKTLDQAAVASTTCIARLVQIHPAATITEFIEYADKLIKLNDFWYIVSRTVSIVSRTIV